MRAVRLPVDGAEPVTITLHPRLTIVTGLDPRQRAALAEQVAAVVDDAACLEELRAEVAAAEAEARAARAAFDGPLAAELERAHAETEAAEAAATLIVRRRRTRRRLAAARALERALLEGMGYQSYNEALLARLAPTIDLAVEERLLAARRALAEALRRPVPMLIDDAVVTVDGDEVEPVLRHLLHANVQAVWLTDDPLAVAAALGLGSDRAAVVEAGRSSAAHRV